MKQSRLNQEVKLWRRRVIVSRFKFVLIVSMLLFSCGFSNIVFSGTISGSVKFTGTVPPPEKISMNADPACSAAHAEPVFEESVAVDSTGGLQNVFVYVAKGLEGKSFAAPSEPVVIDQKGCHYHPHVLGLQVGQALQIVNSDNTLHNVHSLASKSKSFNLGMPLQGMTIKKKFDAAEVMVKFKCDVHPWMNAYIGVLTHPYFSVSGPGGTFELKDLPDGEYTVEAWHEKFGTQSASVTVTEGGASNIEFTFF